MYVYSADTYCDSCGESICASLTRDGLAPEDPSDPYSFDSGDYPKYGAEESTDGPDHCAAGADCLEGIDLGAYGLGPDAPLYGAESRTIGALLSDGLTDEGVAYLAEMLGTDEGVAYLAEMLEEDCPTPYQRALRAFWRETFDVDDTDD